MVGKPKVFGNAVGATTIFTANYPKGLVLESVVKYLSTLGIDIENVIEVDDNLKYLQNLKSLCEKNNLNFIGLHYTFANDSKCELNADLVLIQKNYFTKYHELISDKVAMQISEDTIKLKCV